MFENEYGRVPLTVPASWIVKMQTIASGNGFTISSSFGTAVVEGSAPDGVGGPGRQLTFSLTQNPVSIKTVYVQIVPLSGQTEDFWDNFWSNKVDGEPADQFALSSFVNVESNGTFSVLLNADSLSEGDEEFEIRVYESNMDAAFGYQPLLVGKFTILDDDIRGTNGDDIINGRSFSENIMGLGGDDVINSGAGDDWLNGGVGADRLAGGAGNDTYIIDNVGDRVVEAANSGVDTVRASISYTLPTNVETLILTGNAHTSGTGNVLANRIYGNIGNNTLNGGVGADRLAGGAGNDTYIIDNVGDRVVEAANSGVDTVRASISYTLPTNVETLILTGNAHTSGTGNVLANRIYGNIGNNTLNGGAGNDVLSGGGGNDRLTGGAGYDKLTGGQGIDFFIFNDGDTKNSLNACDVVTDFDRGNDKLDFRLTDANLDVRGDQQFEFSGTDAATNSLWYAAVGENIVVMGDNTGDGISDFKVMLFDANSLGMHDLLF
jgi:Ca2+-binding RTX toxin-like protein